MKNCFKRIRYIDYAKTFAILLVVIGHVFDLTMKQDVFIENIRFIVYTLHVPAFLFCAGVLFQKTVMKYSLIEILKMKICNLLLVFGIWSVLLIVWNYLVDYAFRRNLDMKYYLSYSMNQIWFLWFLFFSFCFILVIELIKINDILITILLLLAFLISAFVNVGIAKIILHTLIVWIGFQFKAVKKINIIFVIILYCALMIYMCVTKCVLLTDVNNLGMDTIMILGIKILGSLVLPGLFYITPLPENELVARISSNTIYIYVLHFIPLAVYKCLDNESVVVAFCSVIICFYIALFLHWLLDKMKISKYLFGSFFVNRK